MIVYGYDSTGPPKAPEAGPIMAGYLPRRLTAADLTDVACTGCGHPRGTDCGCSCTGPGTCGGGTDDIEGGA